MMLICQPVGATTDPATPTPVVSDCYGLYPEVPPKPHALEGGWLKSNWITGLRADSQVEAGEVGRGATGGLTQKGISPFWPLLFPLLPLLHAVSSSSTSPLYRAILLWAQLAMG